MMRLIFPVIFGLLSVVVIVAGCTEVAMPTTLRQQPRCPLTLGPEDVVTIRVVGESELTGDYQADTEGYIDFPYIERIPLRGMTNTTLATHISKALREGALILEPQVSVVIKNHASARILVDGQVARPGAFNFRTGMTLLEAISGAGGRTRIADRRAIRLTRHTEEGTKTQVIPARALYEGREPDIRLCPGDSIFIPETVL